MVEDVGTTITLEAWDNKYKPNQDWNHAWGAAPANILPRKLLGVLPSPWGEGWARFSVFPHLGSLKWASARVPTPYGAIVVRAESGDEYYLNVTVPGGTTATVIILAKSREAVTVPRRPSSCRLRTVAPQ